MSRSTKNLFTLLGILFFFFQWTGEGYAQCGFHMTEEEQISYLETLRQVRKTASGQRVTSGSTMYVPVKLHVMTRSDGEGGVNMPRFMESFTLMNRHFAQINIQFYICGQINYIASDLTYRFSSDDSSTDLPIGEEETDAINVIYYRSVKRNGSEVGGFAYLPYGPLRIYMSQASDEYTLTHEMGHFYGLQHTFNNSNNANIALRELVTRGAGANCENAGDYLCDTPADPHVPGGPVYFPGCVYTEELYDLNGDRYQPMLNNIMSYYNGCKPEEFTSDQNELMRSYKDLPVRSRWTNTCGSLLPPVDLVAVADPVYGVRLKWKDSQTGALAYVLEISEGNDQNFHFSSIISAASRDVIVENLKNHTTYYFRLKPLNSPDGFSVAASYTTSESYCFPLNNKQCLQDNYTYNGEYPYIGIKSVGFYGETKLEHISECSDYAYDFYFADTIAVYKEIPYQLKVTQMTKGVIFPLFKVLLWIDLNEDGTFDEKNERWMVNYSSAMNAYVARLIMNTSVKPGVKRARIRIVDSGDASISACGNTSYGETQDYLIEVSDRPSNYPLQLTIGDDAKLRWTNSGLPQGSMVTIYMDNGQETRVLDTLSVDQLAYQLPVFGNGEYTYFLRNLNDQTLLSNTVSTQIDSYTYCVPSFISACNAEYETEEITIQGETKFRQSETCSQSGYQLYEGAATSMYKRSLYTVSIKQKTRNGSYYLARVKAWIDFNQDGDFDDANEEFQLVSSGTTYTGTIYVPDEALPGFTGLRVRISNDSKMTACKALSLGETKDYEIEIKDRLNSLPVVLSAVRQGSYLNKLVWSYDNIAGETRVNVYRGRSAETLLLIGTPRLDQLTLSDLVGSNGTYFYVIKDAVNGALLSNTALVEVDDAGTDVIFQLSGAYEGNVPRLEWNVENGMDGIKALLYRSYNGNVNNILRLDTILLTNGYYEDIRLMEVDTLLKYQIRSLGGELLSNTLTIEDFEGYCTPEFKNSNCIEPLSYVWQTKDGKRKQILYRGISNCSDNNKFKFPYLYNPVDTLYHDATYDLFVSLKYPCETGSSGSQRNIRVYLDVNRDSEFSEEEIVVERMADDFACSGTFRFQLPDNMGTGLSRLRYLISEPGYAVANTCGVFEQASGFDFYVYLKGTVPVTSLVASTSSDFLVSIYPNPSDDGSFTIDSEEEVKYVRILGITGETFFEGDKKLIPKLSSGFYMVQIHTGQGGYRNMKLLVR